MMVGLMLVAFMNTFFKNMAVAFMNTAMHFAPPDLEYGFYLTFGLYMYCRNASAEAVGLLNRGMLRTGGKNVILH